MLMVACIKNKSHHITLPELNVGGMGQGGCLGFTKNSGWCFPKVFGVYKSCIIINDVNNHDNVAKLLFIYFF